MTGEDTSLYYEAGTLYIEREGDEEATTIPLPPGLRAIIIREELDRMLGALEEA